MVLSFINIDFIMLISIEKQWVPTNLIMYCFILIILTILSNTAERGIDVGCYKYSNNVTMTEVEPSVETCLSICEQQFYRYAMKPNVSACFCGNSPGLFQLSESSCNINCFNNESLSCGGSDKSASVYDTGVKAPGPPTSFQILNITETTIKVKWKEPHAYSFISGYVLIADALETFADHPLPSLKWDVSGKTQVELSNLHPGTLYEVSVVAENEGLKGPKASIQVETVIGIPEPSPPKIPQKDMRRHGDKITVLIPEAKNVNGPVTKYRIVVSIELYQQGYILENLFNYEEAMEKGLQYYITAEIDPEDIKYDFTIGNGRMYNGYFNAPLAPTKDIDISIGIVSEKNNVRKIRYADPSKEIILNINALEDVSPVVVALTAGVAIGVVLLLIGIGALIIVRKKIQILRLERNSQLMPLSLSEPCLEIENTGFLQEEDEKVDYYGNLKRKLWNIPRSLIDIDVSSVIGLGNYGKFTRGFLNQHEASTPGLIQVIADRELDKPDKKLMLQELDLLIKSVEHENVISLIGICETSTALFVVMQDYKQNLKEVLLQSRQRYLDKNKFSLLSEHNVLQICSNIARGMEFLHNKKIMHKRLSCRNIVINENGIAKVSGFGLSHMRPLNLVPDYTRWTSHEMLRQSRYNPKADVWSFGCLMWEVFTLGATPYNQIPSKDVSARVLRGMRPSQPSYVGDGLFQLCLQCWQVDPDERPIFTILLSQLTLFTQDSGADCLSFTHFNGFTYEPHVPEYEVIS